MLKAAIYEGRLELYRYEPVLEELRALEYDRERGKVDHPKHSAKDVSDSLAGVVFCLSQNARRLPIIGAAIDVEEQVPVQERFAHEVTGGQITGRVDPEDVRAQGGGEELWACPVLMG
jgi:hypothetical protein